MSDRVLELAQPVLAIFFVSILASSCQGNMIRACSGVVATDEVICSKVGRDILVDGGHAVDAAVASALCLGVVSPAFSGLGGGGFMLVRQASGAAKVFDMKEMAPKKASQKMYASNPTHQQQGPQSVAIPGELAGTSYAAKLNNLINDSTTFEYSHYGAKWGEVYDHGTSHICVVDRERNVVSMTTSINDIFGSTFMSPSTGILLNNQMWDFSCPSSSSTRPPSPANSIQPMKRPLSSMTPTVVLNGGKLQAVIGAAGGILIPDAVTQVLLNYIIRRMKPLASVMAPRYYHMLNPNILYYENYTLMGNEYRFPASTLEFLKSRRHRLMGQSGWQTICQFVVQELKGPNTGMLFAVSDPRKGGIPAGY